MNLQHVCSRALQGNPSHNTQTQGQLMRLKPARSARKVGCGHSLAEKQESSEDHTAMSLAPKIGAVLEGHCHKLASGPSP